MSDFPDPVRLELPARTLPTGVVAPPVALSLHEAGEGPAVVLSHGFPELAWSWRHQFPALTEAGFRVLVPDQRGYGASDRPEAVESYDIHHLTGDLVGLLDARGIERAVFVGHDWGGFVAWAMPTLHPERTAGVVGVNTPHMPRSPLPPTQMMRALFPDPERMYVLWFQRPEEPERVLERDVALVFETLMRGGIDPAVAMAEVMKDGAPDMNPFRRLAEIEPLGEPLLGPEELEVYVRAFERSGFFGPVSWYRNFDRNWETAPGIGVEKIEVPCLMVTAEWDPVLRPEMAAGMPVLCPDLETHRIDRCGHWTQQERPDALNRILVDWLRRRFGS